VDTGMLFFYLVLWPLSFTLYISSPDLVPVIFYETLIEDLP
jgi:hypothetical protein